MIARYKISREQVRKWRKQKVVTRAEKPVKPGKARQLGYKAKQGFVVARTRIKKGGRRRPKIRKGRKPKKSGLIHFTTSQSLQAIAEKRVARKFMNLEVLNSYYVGEDGQYKYFEVILFDKHHPSVKKTKGMRSLSHQRRRVFRGLTSAGKKARK